MSKTLGYHRKMCAMVFGENSPATKFLNKEIAEHGENEEVLCEESQLISALSEMHFGKEKKVEGDKEE